MRSRILADAAVRLDLRDAERDAALVGLVREHRAEQERRELDGVAREPVAIDDAELARHPLALRATRPRTSVDTARPSSATPGSAATRWRTRSASARELFGDALRRGAADAVSARDRALDREHVAHVRCQVRRDRGERGVVDLVEARARAPRSTARGRR